MKENKELSYLELIDHISFFRDLANDLDGWKFKTDLEELEKRALDLLFYEKKIEEDQHRVNVAVIGDFSCGKSSFINSLLGEKVCPVGVNPTTSSITCFKYSDSPKILLKTNEGENNIPLEISDEDYFNLVCHQKESKQTKVYNFEYFYPFEGFRHIDLYDTPGFANPKNPNDNAVTQEATQNADVVFFLLDINKGEIAKDVLNTVSEMRENASNCEWYLIITKSDLKASQAGQRIKDKCQEKYQNWFSKISLYSSKIALDTIEQKVNDAADAFKETITEYLARQEPFSFKVTGSKEGKKFILDVNGKQCKLSTDRKTQMLLKRDEIIQILSEIGEKKQQYFGRSYKTSVSTYHKLLKLSMSKMKHDLNEQMRGRSTSEDANLNELNRFMERLKQKFEDAIIYKMPNLLINYLKPEELPAEEQGWFSTKYRFNLDKYRIRTIRTNIESLYIWGDTIRIINDFLKMNDFNINQNRSIRNDLNRTRRYVVDKIINVLNQEYQSNLNDIFYSISEAQEARQKYIDKCKSNRFKIYLNDCKEIFNDFISPINRRIEKQLTGIQKDTEFKAKIINEMINKIDEFSKDVKIELGCSSDQKQSKGKDSNDHILPSESNDTNQIHGMKKNDTAFFNQFSINEEVYVESHGQKYSAVIDKLYSHDAYVKYTGYGYKWGEWVSLDKISKK